MSIEIVCPKCGSLNHVNDRFAGRRVRCPDCDSAVDVPKAKPIDEPQRNGSEAGNAFAGNESTTRHEISSLSPSTPLGTVEPFGWPTNTNLEPNATSVTAVEDEDDDVMPIKVKPDDGELDMTPMVDVTFLLLIFFMITAAFSLQKSIESPRQESDKPSMNSQPEETEELDMVTVQINEYGAYLVLAPDWERETPGKQNLIGALREAMGDGNLAMKLVIEVHEAAKLQSLVDCMDAGTICDYGEMQVTQVEGFDE